MSINNRRKDPLQNGHGDVWTIMHILTYCRLFATAHGRLISTVCTTLLSKESSL